MMVQSIINGQLSSTISAQDRGFQYGDGLFETIAYDAGNLLLWCQHMQRLQNGANRLAMAEISEQQWLDDLRQLTINQPRAVIKLIQSRGVGGRGYYAENLQPTRTVACYPWPDYPASNQDGVRIRICQTPVSVNSRLAGIKHLNRLDNVLARNEWKDPTIVEGLMLDAQGRVIEGTMSNVFGVKQGELYTPDLSHAGVAGIVRQQILHLAQQQAIKTHCINLLPDTLLAMDELFITNSVIGIWPVSQLQQQQWDEGPVTKLLKDLLTRDMYEHAIKI